MTLLLRVVAPRAQQGKLVQDHFSGIHYRIERLPVTENVANQLSHTHLTNLPVMLQVFLSGPEIGLLSLRHISGFSDLEAFMVIRVVFFLLLVTIAVEGG